eukprot:tig00000042_g15506.t1
MASEQPPEAGDAQLLRPANNPGISVDFIRRLIREIERESSRIRTELGDAAPGTQAAQPPGGRRELPALPARLADLEAQVDDPPAERAPAPAAPSEGQEDRDEREQFQTQAERSLRRVQRYVESSSPFIVFCILVLAQRSWLGIVSFAWLLMLCMRSNDIVRSQAAQKENVRVGYLAMWAAFTLSHLVCMSIVFGPSSFLPRLALIPPRTIPSFTEALFAVCVADAVSRLFSILAKGLVVQFKLHLEEPRRRSMLFTAIEALSGLYRGLIPVPVWLVYLSDDSFPDVFSASICGLYIAYKISHSVDRVRLCWSACRAYMSHELPFGRTATAEEIAEDPNCAICHDAMRGAVILACGHTFCQGCVEAWFERERSCPLCRAFVRAAGLGRHADGSTPLLPVVF